MDRVGKAWEREVQPRASNQGRPTDWLSDKVRHRRHREILSVRHFGKVT